MKIYLLATDKKGSADILPAMRTNQRKEKTLIILRKVISVLTSTRSGYDTYVF